MEPQRGPSGAGTSGNPAPPADVTRLAARSFETRLASGSFDPFSRISWADISFTLLPFPIRPLPYYCCQYWL